MDWVVRFKSRIVYMRSWISGHTRDREFLKELKDYLLLRQGLCSMKSAAGPHIKEGISQDAVRVAARKVFWHDQNRTPRICTVIRCVPYEGALSV